MGVVILSEERFAAARRFIEAVGRPLERARLAYRFGNGHAAPVLEALRAYQNADGGFGHALEPDLRAPESSALGTSIAFQVLREIKAPAGEPMVVRGVEYLINTVNRERWTWRSIPATAQQSPHAPWWDQAGREQAFAAYSLNPTAELLGYLWDAGERVPADRVRREITACVLAHLEGLETIKMHELLCCLRLQQTAGLPTAIRERLGPLLAPLVERTVSWDPSGWDAYSLRPVQVVDDPDSPYLPGHEEAVDANLAHEIQTQRDDGSWSLTWSWGDAYPEAWEQARLEWAGVLTLSKLQVLRAHGRIEGIGAWPDSAS
jgi:hypothetical protein